MQFLAAAGIHVSRINDRQYTASVDVLPQVNIIFQRATDIVSKIANGSVDVGITGYDIVSEYGDSLTQLVTIYDDLGYGKCELVIAVPESWVDVSSIEDIVEISTIFRNKGEKIKIATKYPYLSRQWLHKKGIVYFSFVELQGALEVAPSMGYADIIIDISSSGVTLQENKLKKISGGTILKSQACLVGNKNSLRENEGKLRNVRYITELIEAKIRAENFVTLTANVYTDIVKYLPKSISRREDLDELRNLLTSVTYSKNKHLDLRIRLTATMLVDKNLVLESLEHIRQIGGNNIIISDVIYAFEDKSWKFQAFLEKLKL